MPTAEIKLATWKACLLGVFLSVTGVSASFAQSNLGFLRDSPAARFDAEDWKLLREAVQDVLDSEEDATTKTWKNEATGNHGSVTLVNSYRTADGRECRRLRMDNSADGLTGSGKQTMCQAAGGTWRPDTG